MNVECAKCPLQPPTRRGKELELLGQTIAGECSLTGRERWIYLEDVEFILASGFSIGRYGYKLRSEEHTSELQSLMRISYAVFCLKKKINRIRKKNQEVYRYDYNNTYKIDPPI